MEAAHSSKTLVSRTEPHGTPFQQTNLCAIQIEKHICYSFPSLLFRIARHKRHLVFWYIYYMIATSYKILILCHFHRSNTLVCFVLNYDDSIQHLIWKKIFQMSYWVRSLNFSPIWTHNTTIHQHPISSLLF